MDSTEFNKIAGAALGALLVFLLLNFFSGQIYGTREAGGHHGEEVLAFALAVETEAAGEAGEEPPVDYATLVAAADPAEGESVFRACSACHKIEEGANAVGPHLWGVVGRDIAAAEGFSYSDALAAAEGDWTLEHLSGFLENPKAWAPGTKMTFAGLDDPQDRVNVIAYLNEADGSPVDLAAGLEPLAAAMPDAGTAIPDPSLSPGVGPGPGVNPPGEAAEGAPAQGESAGIEAASEAAAVEDSAQAVQEGTTGAAAGGVVGAEPGAAETSVSEGDDAGGRVTGVTIVDNTEEGADVPTTPAAETHEAERTGEDILDTSDPSPEAPAQQAPGTAGAPGEGAAPVAGAPEAGDPDEAARTPGQEAPEDRVEGEDAPPQEAPSQAPERGAAVTGVDPVVPDREGVEVEATPMQIEEEDPPSAEALPPALQPGETRDDPRAEPLLEPQAEQTPPGEAPASGPGGPAGQAPASEAYSETAGVPDTPPADAGAAAAVLATADAAAGEKIFRRCAACHKLEEGVHGIGPSLYGVVGRDVAALEDYEYSDAMAAHEGDWTVEHLSDYLENPKAVVPGTKMAFAGLRDEQDRLDVIGYLNQVAPGPQ